MISNDLVVIGCLKCSSYNRLIKGGAKLKKILCSYRRAKTDEVILQLVFSKCIPVLLYGLESVSLILSDVRSL